MSTEQIVYAIESESNRRELSEEDFERGAIDLLKKGAIKVGNAFIEQELSKLALNLESQVSNETKGSLTNLKIDENLNLPGVFSNEVLMCFILFFFPDLYFILTGFCVRTASDEKETNGFDYGTMDLFGDEELIGDEAVPPHELLIFVSLNKQEDNPASFDYVEGSHLLKYSQRREINAEQECVNTKLRFGECLMIDSRLMHRQSFENIKSSGSVLILRYSLPWFYDVKNPKKLPKVEIDQDVYKSLKMSHQLILSHALGTKEWRHDRW